MTEEHSLVVAQEEPTDDAVGDKKRYAPVEEMLAGDESAQVLDGRSQVAVPAYGWELAAADTPLDCVGRKGNSELFEDGNERIIWAG